MSDLPRPSQRRLEFQARKIEQLELVIASQSDLISLLRSQLHIHSESTLLLQRRFGDACTRSSATSALAATVVTANATPSPPYPVTTPADADPFFSAVSIPVDPTGYDVNAVHCPPPIAAPAVIHDDSADPAAYAIDLFYANLCSADADPFFSVVSSPVDPTGDDATAATCPPIMDSPAVHNGDAADPVACANDSFHTNLCVDHLVPTVTPFVHEPYRTTAGEDDATSASPTPPPADPIADGFVHEPYISTDDFPTFMDNTTPPPTSINFNDHYPAAPSTPSPALSSTSGGDASTIRDLRRSLRSSDSDTGSDIPSLQSSSTEESCTPTPSPPTTPRSLPPVISGPGSTCQTPPSTPTSLTAGACRNLWEGSKPQHPVFQVANSEVPVVPALGNVLLTDGEHSMVAVLPDNHRARRLRLGCYVRLLTYKFHVNDVPRPIFVNSFEVVSGPREIKGPTHYDIEQYFFPEDYKSSSTSN